MHRTVSGGAAGIAATSAMTLVIAAAKAAGLIHTPPPAQITANAGSRSGTPLRALPDPLFSVSWLFAHVAYGAVLGATYAFIRAPLPRRASLAGILYGLGVYISNYAGALPALGLYPNPTEDSSARQQVMIMAHIVYGVTLGELYEHVVPRP